MLLFKMTSSSSVAFMSRAAASARAPSAPTLLSKRFSSLVVVFYSRSAASASVPSALLLMMTMMLLLQNDDDDVGLLTNCRLSATADSQSSPRMLTETGAGVRLLLRRLLLKLLIKICSRFLYSCCATRLFG
jgi:hypothetical protein